MTHMKLHIVALLGLIVMAPPERVYSNEHPRIWLTPTLLSALRAKAAAGDADWLRIKADADSLLSRRMPRFTVTAATRTNPVRLTLAEEIRWSGSTAVFIAGATGAWAALNTVGDRPSAFTATRVGPNVFSVPVDASRFGSFAGQRLTLFFSEGEYSAYGYQGLGWQAKLEALAIAHQVTTDAAYASQGRELLAYIASLGVAGMLAPVAIDSGFPTRSAIYGMAIAYDWLHDRLTVAERAAVAQTLNLWFDWFKRAAYEHDGPGYGNYFGGHVLGFGLAGLATQGDNPRASEIVAHILSLFQTHVVPAFAKGGFAGGYPLEGYPYGSNHFQRLLSYMLAVDTATGASTVAKSGYPHKIARNLLYNLKPNNWQVTDEANCAGDYTGVLSPSLPIVLSSLLAGTEEGKWMQHLYHTLGARPDAPRHDAFVKFVFYNHARPAADYRDTLPTWFYSPGDHHLYRRSSWLPNAVWTSMAGGSTRWAGHQLRGAGHIAIQRGDDYLLVNSGQWKGPTGIVGQPQAFDLRSWRANTLFTADYGDYLFTDADYLGGQGHWGTSNVLARDGGPDFAYMKTDLSSAYSVGHRKPWSARSVRYFHRSFLSLGSSVVVVFDRIQSRQANYVKKLYFHLNPTGGPPAISGVTASIRAGRSALFLRTLLPAAPVLAVAADPVSDSDGRAITYRLEVSDSVPNTTFDALHVLVATPSSTTAMPATARLQSTNGLMIGAVVADGAVERVGLFSADGSLQASVGYAANVAGRAVVHVVADLLPNVQYLIDRDGRSLGAASASSNGVLTFRSSEGGLFTLRSSGTPSTPLSRRQP